MRHRRAIILIAMFLLAMVCVGVFWLRRDRTDYNPPAGDDDKTAYSQYAGSASCRECHRNTYELWRQSNHGLAERPMDPEMDDAAFASRSFKHGTQSTEIRKTGGRFEVIADGFDGRREAYQAQRVIGNRPLRQYLVAAPGGRLQTLEASYDPAKDQWFNVFGDEDRKPGEWGHWTGRGMNWNNMCASCHNTRVRKNYDIETDSYATAMAELTVGCEACHGPMKNHVLWQQRHGSKKADPTLRKFTPDRWLDTCGSCHARRRELTGDYVPGDSFFSHYSLSIPDHTDLFYPDGQVRDEDYEYTSFLSSRMNQSNVRCVNCHNPHTARPILEGNTLCMSCHNGSFPKSPKIDAATHTFHKPDSTGSLCTECHMPQTVYMQRHWRHDHGFTIPDPLLTKHFGIPNACNRCHKDKDADWALEACDKWYGVRMDRPTRRRAQTIARGRLGREDAREELLKVLAEEPIALWQASAAALLAQHVARPEVVTALVGATRHPDPLVREMAARSLEPLADSQTATLERLLSDRFRNVRNAAQWILRARISPESAPGRELLAYLRLNSDQPGGAMAFGLWHLGRQEPTDARRWFLRAADWDQHSAAPYDALAVLSAMAGDSAGSLASMRKAVELEPNHAEWRYKLGLAYNEAGDRTRTIESLEQAVKLDPRHAAAMYNLGLAYEAAGDRARALQTLLKAETLEPGSPRAPYAIATILARLRQTQQAREAALRALRADPRFTPARELLQSLGDGG